MATESGRGSILLKGDGTADPDNDDVSQEGPDEDDDEEELTATGVLEGFFRIRPSCIPSLPPTVFVDYPPELGIRRDDLSETIPLGTKKLQYKSHWERICIRNAFNRAGFMKGGKLWTAMWSKHQSQTQLDGLNCLQKVNHFPASWCIGRKDRLSRTLMAMKRIHGREFDFHPETFVMPQDKDAFHRTVKPEMGQSSRKQKKSLWIAKPCASSCGRGISVVTTSQAWAMAEKKKVLVQRYLSNPYLINNKKFDLRIYVLVSGVDPLRVYIHNEGLTRISTSDYSLNNIANRFAHLTNYSVNKKADVFKAAAYSDGDPLLSPDSPQSEDVEGFKWSLKAFKKWLSAKEGETRTEEVFTKIHDICVKTIIAAEGEITPQLQRAVLYRTNCFELFGMDVILDENLNPQLLEVNVSPSLMGSSPLDKRIKGMMIADVLHTVGLYAHDSEILRKYSESISDNSGRAEGNPFAFCNLSKLLSCQETYRRNPCSNTVDFSSLKDIDEMCGYDYCNWWQMLLMIEDEFSRSKSSGFQLIHPTPQKASFYTNLYRNSRFSDQMLAKWVEMGGLRGRAMSFLPASVRSNFPKQSIRRSEFESGEQKKQIFPQRPKSANPSRPGTSPYEVSLRRPTSATKLRTKAAGASNFLSLKEYLTDHSNPFKGPQGNDTNHLKEYTSVNINTTPRIVLESQSEKNPGSIKKDHADWNLISRINRNIVIQGSNHTNDSALEVHPTLPPPKSDIQRFMTNPQIFSST